MFLKRLELFGFKSFYEKTVLEFNKGITAVVGPNGSGKSNISDAIRWVLGEQSAKSLRGAKMEDVIFAGTANRRGVALAEVSMALDNTCGTISIIESLKNKDGDNLHYDEITITRRVYRSGESQYLINGVGVRLRDIHELFMDTGIGKEGYSIIGQGRIEDVLSVKSEDRRLLFEEAAGIVKFKARKNEAENKLEKEKQNFLRVCDIISELETQLEPLHEMAEKAKKYLELAERLKLVKVNSFLHLAASQKEEGRNTQGNIETVLEQKAKAEEDTLLKKEEAKKARENLTEKTEAIERLQDEIREVLLNAEKKENDIKMANQTILYIDEQINRVNNEIKQKNSLILSSEKEALVFRARHKSLLKEQREKSLLEEEVNTSLSRISSELKEREKDLENFNSGHIEKLKSTNDVNSRIEALGEAYSQLESRKEELGEEESAYKEKEALLLKELKQIEESLKESRLSHDTLQTTGQNYLSHKTRLAGYYDGIKETFKAEAAALADAKSKKKLLSELEAGYEGYQFSVKNLMLAVKNGKAKLTGLYGAVGELIQVDAEYETLAEAALGGAIMDVAAENEEACKAAIEYLKAAKGGKATFLPINAIKPRDIGKIKDSFMREPGVLGTVSDFVTCEPKYQNIVSNLLGRVIAVDDMDNAIAFTRKYKNEYKVVTLTGEVFNPGGAITGGYLGKSSRILSRRREIDRLDAKIANLEKSTAEKQKDMDELSAKLASASEQIEKNKVLVHELQIKRASLELSFQQGKKQLNEAQAKLASIKKADCDIMARLESINHELRDKKTLKTSIEKEISGILNDIAKKRANIQSLKDAHGEKMKELTSVQVDMSRISEGTATALENAERVEKSIADAKEGVAKAFESIESFEIEKEAKYSLVNEISDEIIHLKEEKTEKDAQLLILKEERQIAEESVSKLSQEEIGLMQLISGLELELERLASKKEQLETERSKLFDEMWEEYNITLQSAAAYEKLDFAPAKLRQEELSLKNAIREMGGTVNLGAVEEYKVLKERHEFLVKQRDDIGLAEEKLKGVILELKKLMEERFSEQLKIISKNFGDVFSEMFGGGTASLKLADESNILESGIDIVAKPPGKALQSLSLFSGGERALCAIALLFGILRMKPSPFCVLDEIETALDDANVRRFARFIKNYSGGTQFIVITHRKGTMEEADALYGVTMQEAGVSKLVSVKFEDTKEEAS